MWQRHFCVVCLTEPIYKVSLFVILGPCLYCSCCHVIKSPNQCLETYCFCSVSYYYYYVTPNAVGWRIAILRFFFTIIIITSPRTQLGDVLLFYVSFSLLFLLRHPERSRVTYCYSTFLFHYYYYYITPTAVGWCIVILLFLLFLLLLFFHTFLSARFLGDALIKLYETF